MYKSNSLRIFPLILSVVIGVALIAGLITISGYLFAGDDGKKSDSELISPRDELVKLNTSRSVQVTIRGPIVANEEFETIRIKISPNYRKYNKYSGYLEDKQFAKSYKNNMKAYEQFVYALDKARMTRPGKNKPTEEMQDIRGICATGKVYDYEILDGQQVVYRAWTSTCKGSQGTFGASVKQVNNLFISQIPEKDRPKVQLKTLRF